MKAELLKKLAEVLPKEWQASVEHEGEAQYLRFRVPGPIDHHCVIFVDLVDVSVTHAFACFLLLDLLESKGWDWHFNNYDSESGDYNFAIFSGVRKAAYDGSTRTEAIVRAVVEALKEKP